MRSLAEIQTTLRAALGSEALNRRRIETAHSLVGLVEQSGAERHGAPPPGERIGRITAAILVGGAGEMVVAWLDGRIDVSRQQLVDDATELFIASMAHRVSPWLARVGGGPAHG